MYALYFAYIFQILPRQESERAHSKTFAGEHQYQNPSTPLHTNCSSLYRFCRLSSAARSATGEDLDVAQTLPAAKPFSVLTHVVRGGRCVVLISISSGVAPSTELPFLPDEPAAEQAMVHVGGELV